MLPFPQTSDAHNYHESGTCCQFPHLQNMSSLVTHLLNFAVYNEVMQPLDEVNQLPLVNYGVWYTLKLFFV